MANWRMMPPTSGALSANATTVNGRSYSPPSSHVLDVPDFDGPGLRANGWSLIAEVGTTAQRPTSIVPEARYVDTTLGKIITWDGAAWRDYAGTAV